MRDLAEDQRAAGRDKVMAEMRSKIAAMLTPEQRTQYQAMQTTAQPKAPKADAAASAATSAAPAAAPANGGPATEFRNRVVSELKLGAQQAAQVDAIYAESRPKFMALRDLAPEERAKARDRLTSDIRARIADTLTPEQKPKFAALVAEAASRTSTRGRIYLMGDDGKPKAFSVRLGITDGTNTELIVSPAGPDAAELKEGATVIIGVQSQGAAKTGAPKSAAPTPRFGF